MRNNKYIKELKRVLISINIGVIFMLVLLAFFREYVEMIELLLMLVVSDIVIYASIGEMHIDGDSVTFVRVSKKGRTVKLSHIHKALCLKSLVILFVQGEMIPYYALESGVYKVFVTKNGTESYGIRLDDFPFAEKTVV